MVRQSEKLSSNFQKLPQERIDKANPRHNLTAEEVRCFAKLEAITKKLNREKTCKIVS